MVSTVRATFAVTTPMFPGGADPKNGPPELRPPSIKGVLRFWWRALAWSRHSGNRPEIHEEEAKIFGTAGDGSSHGQASFILRVAPGGHPTRLMPPAILTAVKDKVGARYFGYGLMKPFGGNAGQLSRPCLLAPFEFTIEVISRDTLDPSLVDALKLMGLLGGLGSRTRRGWGSLSLRSLEGAGQPWEAPTNQQSYKQELLDVIGDAGKYDREPPYSAIWERTRIEIVGSDIDPLRLLNTIGEQMIRYRSWGRNGKVDHIVVDQNFKDDHDWFVDGRDFNRTHPRRIVFGLPHNYFRKHGNDVKNVGVTTEKQAFGRRASPLLVHVHRLTDQSCISVLTVLRSQFLPAGERLKVTHERKESLRDAAPDWTVLNGFIDGTSKTKQALYFPKCTPVLP